MECKQINNLTMKYFDGNISEIELEQLMHHNQKCPSCAEEFEVLKDAIFGIETLPEIDPPLELTANIMAAVANQKHLQVNARQLICWLMGFMGLVVFTYNIIAFVIFPMMGGAPLVSFQSVLRFIYLVIEKAKDGFVAMSLYLGKLMILRNIIFKEYTMFIFLWLAAFVAVGFMLVRKVNMKKNSDFADLK
ncbi:MAG: hypothetical protein A2Y23_02535 [Clostridiales bacterium GWB2_37_7]|nr:MAG: hypothetical protein A2Y23_02535 [Clostridiales bacterium GWB2_37_7]